MFSTHCRYFPTLPCQCCFYALTVIHHRQNGKRYFCSGSIGARFAAVSGNATTSGLVVDTDSAAIAGASKAKSSAACVKDFGGQWQLSFSRSSLGRTSWTLGTGLVWLHGAPCCPWGHTVLSSSRGISLHHGRSCIAQEPHVTVQRPCPHRMSSMGLELPAQRMPPRTRGSVEACVGRPCGPRQHGHGWRVATATVGRLHWSSCTTHGENVCGSERASSRAQGGLNHRMRLDGVCLLVYEKRVGACVFADDVAT